MSGHLVEHWSDTLAFRAALVVSGCIVLPLLFLGLFVSLGMLVTAIAAQTANLPGAIVVVLSLGGGVGMFGWLRAHHEVKTPGVRDPLVTCVCLAIGTLTASAVAAIPLVVTFREFWGELEDVWPVLLLGSAPAVWALSGVARLQKLLHAYAQGTGRAFDGMPAAMLVVAIVLAAAATLIAISL
jgi:hypothetical protein